MNPSALNTLNPEDGDQFDITQADVMVNLKKSAKSSMNNTMTWGKASKGKGLITFAEKREQ